MLDSYFSLGLLAAALALLALILLLAICLIWPSCWVHQRCVGKKKDPAAADKEDKAMTELWERHPNFWLPSHDIEAGDSSQASDLDDVDYTTALAHRKRKSLPGERTGLRTSAGGKHYRSTHLRQHSSDAAADPSPTDPAAMASTGLGQATRLSAIEATITWRTKEKELVISMQRLLMRSFKAKKADLVLKIILHKVKTEIADSSSGDTDEEAETVFESMDKELYKLSVTGAKEQTLTDTIHVNVFDHVGNFALWFWICERKDTSSDDSILEGQLSLDNLNADMPNYVCVMMKQRPVSQGQKGEAVLSLCYLPTAEKLSIAILECKNLHTKAAEERHTGIFVKVALVHRGRALKKKKTKSKPIQSHILFNETYTFDVPRKHVQSISIVLTFKQLIFYPNLPRMTEKTVGKTVLGAAAQSESAQEHWREMIISARKPIIQWQAIW